jgi:pilus assembly protein Flp/PilA
MEVESMHRFVNTLARFLRQEDGPTAVEYAVMLALIIVVCIAAITSLGSSASQTFSYVNGNVTTPAAS